MIIKNTSYNELQKALELTNKLYDNNITWNNFRQENNKGTRFRVTLKCKDSKKAGHRLGFPYSRTSGEEKQRRLISACWHVHGDFFDALLDLNPEIEIQVATHKINKDGGNWQDRNIGSMMRPLYYSEACECE